jgi:N-acetylneuraminic acid mutarotase
MSQLRTLFLLICAAAVLFLNCGLSPMAGGSGSEVNGHTCQASLKPVAGAKVYLDTARKIDTTAMPDTSAIHLDSTTSDADGNFRIPLSNNSNGVYTISCSANNGGLVAFKSNVLVNRPSNYDGVFRVNVDTLTMLPPGKISGKVVINATTMAGIICYIPGTSFMAMSDTAGGFTISGVPPGTNDVYYFITGYETGKVTSVTVISNQVTVLPVAVLSLDPLGAPLPPIGLSASADTANGVVNLSWRSVKVSDLVGYLVMRRTPADSFASITATPVTDTFFSDKIFNSPQDTVAKTFFYSIKTVDLDQNKSANCKSVQITVPPPSYVRPFVQMSIISPINDTANSGDLVKIAAVFGCTTTVTNSLTWFTKAPDSVFLKKTDVSAKQGADTLFTVWNASGKKVVYIDALDARGSTWRNSAIVVVLPGAVNIAAVASTDSSVRITWRKSSDPAFTRYLLYSADTSAGAASSLAATDSLVQDTAITIVTRKNGIKKYDVKVVAGNGLISLAGNVASGGIINTPPRIITDTAAIAKTANAGILYHIKLAVADPNKDSMSFTQLSSNAGLTISDSAVSWTPGVSDTGTKHISVRVSDGWGGADTVSWDVLVTPSNVWSSIAPLSMARRFLSAAVINGVLYAAGGGKLRFDGMNYAIYPSDTVEAFSLVSGTAWSPVASLPTARYRTACAPLSGTLFSFGGFGSYNYVTTVDSFNPISNSWGIAGQLPTVRVGAAVCSYGNKLYLIGGQSYAGSFSTVSSNIDEWDPASGWTAKATMKKQRMDHQAVLLNNKIYIIGGLGGSVDPNNCVPMQSVEVYDPATNRLDTAASLNTGRWYFGAAEANGKIYAIGGLYSFETDSSLASVEEYDPAQNAWIIKAALLTARFGCAAVSWQGKIYVVGGAEKPPAGTGTRETNSVMVFYP